MAVTNDVKNTLSSRGVTCRLENSPKGDAHGMSNGESESSVAIAQGLTRTLKDHVEFNREDDQPQITIVTTVGGVRSYSLHTVFF